MSETSKPIIHLVKTRLVNSYVVEYPDKLLVIDVAVKCHRYVLGFIETQLRRNITDVALVVCTHDDPDHIGGVRALAQLAHADVAIPYASQKTFRKWKNDPVGGLFRFSSSVREVLRPRAWNMYVSPARDKSSKRLPKFVGAKSDGAQVDTNCLRLKDKQTFPGFDDWQVVHTPGHSWDSCCFFHEGSNSLVTGDTLLGSGQEGKLVVPSIYSNGNQTRASMRRLSQLPIASVYPGHGSVIQGENLIPQV